MGIYGVSCKVDSVMPNLLSKPQLHAKLDMFNRSFLRCDWTAEKGIIWLKSQYNFRPIKKLEVCTLLIIRLYSLV